MRAKSIPYSFRGLATIASAVLRSTDHCSSRGVLNPVLRNAQRRDPERDLERHLVQSFVCAHVLATATGSSVGRESAAVIGSRLEHPRAGVTPVDIDVCGSGVVDRV